MAVIGILKAMKVPIAPPITRKKITYISEAEKFVDISNLFDDENDTVFYDNVHYVEKGNNLIAKEILKKLNDHYKLDLNNNVEIKNCVK